MNEIYEKITRAALVRAILLIDVAIIRTMTITGAGVFLANRVVPVTLVTSSSANGLSAIAAAP